MRPPAHATHTNESGHTYERVTAHLRMRRITVMPDAAGAPNCRMKNLRTYHVTHNMVHVTQKSHVQMGHTHV